MIYLSLRVICGKTTLMCSCQNFSVSFKQWAKCNSECFFWLCSKASWQKASFEILLALFKETTPYPLDKPTVGFGCMPT